jgi:hypothetical protein
MATKIFDPNEVEQEVPEILYVESGIGWEIRRGRQRLAFLAKADGWTREQVQQVCDIKF